MYSQPIVKKRKAALLLVLIMIGMTQVPIMTSQTAEEDDSNSISWPLSGSTDTGWVVLETVGAIPNQNQPGYANWEMTFPPGAQISNVSLEVGVDGANGVSLLNPELFSPDTQYSFFDWGNLGGFGYQDGFLDGQEHSGRLAPNSDMGAMYRVPAGADITELILEALSPVDTAVSFNPLELDITASVVDPTDGRLYIAVGNSIMQLDIKMDPVIIHLRENLEATDLYIDNYAQRLLVVHTEGISAYDIDDGQYLGDLPPPSTATGSGGDVVFTHVYSTVYDVYAVSSEGLFRLDAGGNDWTIEQVSGSSEWPHGEPQDVEHSCGSSCVLYVSLMGGGIARWDTTWNTPLTPLDTSTAAGYMDSDNVHEMIMDSNMLYIASTDAGLFRYSHLQDAWMSAWNENNWLDSNEVIGISDVDGTIFIVGPDTLHRLESNVGIITNDYDVYNELDMGRTPVDIISWSANGGMHSPVSSIALLGDGTGKFSVLDPTIQSLWTSTVELASGPTGMEMSSVVQIGDRVFVASGEQIDVFNFTSLRWEGEFNAGTGQDIVAMATDGSSVLYVALTNPVNILELSTDGNLLRIWGSGDVSGEILDLEWDSTGHLVVSHQNSASVIELNTSRVKTVFEWDVGIVNDLVTRSGIAYLATDTYGIVRLDLVAGTELSPWQSSGLDELERMPIAAGNGMIYLGAPGYGVLLIDQTTGEAVDLWEDSGGTIPDDDIRAIHIDIDGQVWVGTSDGAMRYDGQSFEDIDAGWDTGDTFYDFDSEDHFIWVAMQDDEICRWERDTIDNRECWDDDDGLPSAGQGIWYNGVKFIGTNKLLVTSNNGAAVFDTNTLSVTDEWIPSGAGTDSAPVVQYDGIIYLGISGDGIARYDSVNDLWLPTWNSAGGVLPDDDVVEMTFDESREMLWAGGEFGLAQIDIQSGMLSHQIDQSTNGLNGNSPQKLLIHDDILYYVPLLSSWYFADIARIALSNNSGLDPISVGDGHIQSGGDGDGLDAYIHGLNIIDDMMILGVSEAQYQGGGIDYGRIIRYNLTNESWESPWEPINEEEIDRITTAYIDSHIYIAYDEDMIRQLDSSGNLVNEWDGVLDGPIRDIIEYNNEVLFATESGIARYDPSGDNWLQTWTPTNGGMNSSTEPVVTDLHAFTNNNGDVELWYASGIRQSGGSGGGIQPSINRVTDDVNGDGVVNGSDHDHWETGWTTGIPAGDVWEMVVCSNYLHVAIRWNGQFGFGGGVGKYDLNLNAWEITDWNINNGLLDDDVVALACDEQEIIYIGYEGDGEGISRYDHASDTWLNELDISDGISEDAVWYGCMDWSDGVLVAGHYEAGFSTIIANGSTISNGSVMSPGLEVSSITPVQNAPFGSGFILGRPGTDQGTSRVDWFSGGQLYLSEFDSSSAVLGFTSGAIEAIAGNSTHIYIAPTTSRFGDLGNTILEGVINANGSVTWIEEWAFAVNTIRDIQLVDNNLWVSTDSLGLWQLDLNSRQLSLVAGGMSTNTDGMYLDGDILAIGLVPGGGGVSGVELLNTSSVQWSGGGLIPGMISSMINDAVIHQYKTWFATPAGVGVWNNSLGIWEESLTVANGLPTPVIDQLYVHSSGELWMATPVGLVRYNPYTNTFNSTIDRLSGLVGDRVSSFTAGNGKLFLSHNGAGATTPGASVIDLATISVDYTVKLDQLPSNNILALAVDSWGVHIATDSDPIVHYNASGNTFEDGVSSWQTGAWPATGMASDGSDLFILFSDKVVRIDAQGTTHSTRNEWSVSGVDEDISLGNNGLFAVGAGGMYGWTASPQFELMDRYMLRQANPLSVGFIDTTLDISDLTHPGQYVTLATPSNTILVDAQMGSNDLATMRYADIPVVLTSSASYAPTYLRSHSLFYSGEWDLSDTDTNIGFELQKILDGAISTSQGMDIELRLKSSHNGSMMVRLTYDWVRVQTPVEITNLVDRADDGGGYLTATWTSSPDPDFETYHVYLISTDDVDMDLGTLTADDADASSSILGQTSLDIGISNGNTLQDGEEYYAVVIVEYDDGSLGEPSAIFGPAIPIDDIPLPPEWAIANPAESGEDGDLAVEWTQCKSVDLQLTRIHIYDQPISDALVITQQVDIDGDTTNSTILSLESGKPYWLALTCVDNAGQEDLANPLILGPVIPVGGLDDGIPPPSVIGVSAYDTPEDEGGKVTVEWVPPFVEDCAYTTVYAMDSALWMGWDVDPVTGQDVRTDIPLTASDFDVGKIISDCDTNSTIITSINGQPLIDGDLYYFAVVAADKWLNEDRINVEIVEATPERQVDTGLAPPNRVGFIDAWDKPADDGSAIQVSWLPSDANDFAFYIAWANSEPVTDLEDLWGTVGDDQINCGCIRINQQFFGSNDDVIEITMDRARYGPSGQPLTSDAAMQKGVIPDTPLHVTVTAHDVKGNVWLTELPEVVTIPVNNIDDTTPPLLIEGVSVEDWPDDDGTAVSLEFELGSESDIEQYAVYASSEQFSEVGFGGPPEPVIFVDRDPSMPIKVERLSNGDAIVADMTVWIAVVVIDSGGNSIITGLSVDSAVAKDNLGLDPGNHLPDIGNVRANWINSGDAIIIEWDAMVNPDIDHVEIYISNENWETTLDATYVASVDIVAESFEVKHFGDQSLDNSLDWYIGVSAADEVTHRHIIGTVHVDAYGEGSGDNEGLIPDLQGIISSPTMLIAAFAILIAPIVFFALRSREQDSMWDGSSAVMEDELLGIKREKSVGPDVKAPPEQPPQEDAPGFPGWSQEMVDSYLDKGWTMEQLKEWYNQNK